MQWAPLLRWMLVRGETDDGTAVHLYIMVLRLTSLNLLLVERPLHESVRFDMLNSCCWITESVHRSNRERCHQED